MDGQGSGVVGIEMRGLNEKGEGRAGNGDNMGKDS